MSLVPFICGRPWLVQPETLDAILAIALREGPPDDAVARAFHHSADAVEAAILAHRLGTPLDAVAQRDADRVDDSGSLERRGATAIVTIRGPILRYGSMLSSMSGGGATVEGIARDFTRALEDPSFAAILLNIDSPGGEVNGIAELADIIYAARGAKPLVAYVSDLGASAGYWLASSAERIVVAQTAALGSIGAVAAIPHPNATRRQEIEFVSSVSPNKRPDPTTKKGAAQYQALVDTIGQIFVDAVARNRGVTAETVVKDFGAGGLLVGRDAVAAGLADDVGSFEGVLADLAERDRPARRRPTPVASTPPAGQPVAATGARDLPDTPTAPSPSEPTKGIVMSLRDKFNAWLDSVDGAAVSGSADQEAAIVSQNLPAAAPQPPATTSPPTRSQPQPPPQALPQPEAESVPPAVASRLAELEAQNARLRMERITERAQTFAREQLSALRAMPAEQATIVALYAQMAVDDERLGGLAQADGTTVLRTTLLANLYAARPSRRELTDDALGSAVAQVLTDRASESKSRRDPNAPMTPAERAEMLRALGPEGEAILAEEAAAGRNGTGR
jgi:ClpP class serine protease